jgi:hypothetical protein
MPPPIGGSARGYQGLSALLAISTTGEQQAARAVCLCMASARPGNLIDRGTACKQAQ